MNKSNKVWNLMFKMYGVGIYWNKIDNGCHLLINDVW